VQYVITSGYFCSPDDNIPDNFYNIWYQNTISYTDPKKIIILNSESKKPTKAKGEWIDIKNFQHVQQADENPVKFAGWSISVITGATLAYANGCDFIYKEQDVLAYGPWIKESYNYMEKNNLKMLIGDAPEFVYKVENGLIIIKHSFILEFLYLWFRIKEYDTGHIVDRKRPETKFHDIQQDSDYIGFFPFGYGAHCDEVKYSNSFVFPKDRSFWVHRQFNNEFNKFITNLKNQDLV
jgi:hypothetical protein